MPHGQKKKKMLEAEEFDFRIRFKKNSLEAMLFAGLIKYHLEENNTFGYWYQPTFTKVAKEAFEAHAKEIGIFEKIKQEYWDLPSEDRQ